MPWRDIVAAYRQPAERLVKPEQPALFELKEEHRPPAERTAAGRYLNPSLFDRLQI
jgi:hypothetical protein